MTSIKTPRAQAAMVCAALLAGTALAPRPTTAAPVGHQCGAVLKSVVKTDAVPGFATQSTSFVNLPGTVTNVNVPAGESRCVKVRLSLSGRCSDDTVNDYCTVIVTANNVALEPNFNGINFIPPGVGGGAHSFQWIKRLDEGTHTIRVKVAVQNAMTIMNVDHWTLEIETSE